jgi:hypothetical protein
MNKSMFDHNMNLLKECDRQMSPRGKNRKTFIYEWIEVKVAGNDTSLYVYQAFFV